MAAFDVGDLVRVSASFYNNSGSLIDPSEIYCKYKLPDATTASLAYGSASAFIKTGTGIYYVDISVTQAGTWHYRIWSGSGTGQTAGESLFQVRKQNVT